MPSFSLARYGLAAGYSWDDVPVAERERLTVAVAHGASLAGYVVTSDVPRAARRGDAPVWTWTLVRRLG